MSFKQKIICIIGPTASGKTRLSIDLAKWLNTEIISADSVQVYKELDIGSAKPTIQEMQGITHHMISVIDVNNDAFSVAEYSRIACDKINEVLNKGMIPIIVGGSGLYISSIIKPLNFAVPSDKDIRLRLEKEYDDDPNKFLKQLSAVDEISAKRLHLKDKKRLVRAMEVYAISGNPISSYGDGFEEESKKNSIYSPIQIGIQMSRELLYKRIDDRVDAMISNGLLNEARTLYEKKYSRSLPGIQSLGYSQLFDYFDGTYTLEQAIENIKKQTRHFAKRQMTWFRRENDIYWIEFDGTDYESLLNSAKKHLEEQIHE